VPANQLGTGGRLAVYASRWGEFLADEPREANSEGGVMPAIFGTVVMTLIMSLLVVPFGVLAALYLREYAKPGPVVSLVRIAINNLAGVPSIVFGVFGLGFFCYLVGGTIDDLFYPEYGDSPVFGKGGLMWASFTLALLTLPVVIVATEEALSAVPRSMREGSYACGASKRQTIRRIVLPRAMPGIMTGMILAIARGAGEVAPLMLVGAVKLAPELPVDGTFPFVHGDRSFMHLGFHIYDVGFQSQNSEAAKPLVFTTTLLLIGLVVVLNVVAIWVRSRLRRKFTAVQA
jgi:phosphate transport system permease protein